MPSPLADRVVSHRIPEETVRQQVLSIHRDVLAHSIYLKEPNFKSIHPHDLEFLFSAYDSRFFDGLCRAALNGSKIGFRLAPRMTRTGGATTRFRAKTGEARYEIAIASGILFDSFRGDARPVSACGIECRNRLEALQRIFEHEMIHLAEQLCWGESSCAAARFQEIAGRFFLHSARTHSLITRRELAAESGVRPGARVGFTFEGLRLTGRVNRITKRATVLVEDPGGQRYSDGLHYKVYYVPLGSLEPVG